MNRHLLITNDFPPKVGGIQAYLWELWRRLDPDSFVVLTASSHPDHVAFDAEQRAAGFDIRRVPGRILYFPAAATLRHIRQVSHDVGATGVVLDPVLPLGLLGPRLQLPYAVILHGAEAAIPSRVPVGRQLMSHVVSHAALVISAGGYPAAEVRRTTGRRLDVLGDRSSRGGRHVCSPARTGRSRRARRDLGLPVAGPLVVSVSRLVPRKGMDVLIRAAARLAPSFPDLTVAIAGGGRDDRRLARLVEVERAPVRLLGRLSESDKAALLGAGDIFAMACRNRWLGLEQEGFGIVFLEAAAAGVPQVAGDSGGAAEAVVDGETGWVVGTPRDPGALALALRRLLLDEGRRRAMGETGRRRVLEAFAYDHLAAKLAGALAEMAG